MTALKARLDKLRRGAGREPGAGADPGAAPEAAPGVGQRLRRLGRGNPPAQGMGEEALAAHLGGRVLAEGVVQITETLPLSHVHGRIPLSAICAGTDHLGNVTPTDVVYMDTETSGLAGGTGTVVFMLGMARLGAGRLELVQYLLTRFAGEGAFLEGAREWLGEAAGMVTFNGRSFDVPLLAARCRLTRCPDPFSAVAQIDLLHPTRRAFGRCWPDCRLQTAEARLLGFTRQDDLPGAMAPQAWFRWVGSGSADLLPGVLAHNRWDLLSLAALGPALDGAYDDPVAWGADPVGVARHHRTRGAGDKAHRILRGAGEALGVPGRHELARSCRRRGDWAGAVAIWESLAAVDDREALECLAKYYEHVDRDWERALGFARRLAGAAPSHPGYRHRLQRLAARVHGRCANGAGEPFIFE